MERKALKRQLSSNSSRIQQQRSKKTISESLQKINEQFNKQHTTAISIWSEWTCSSCETLVRNLLRSEDEHFIFSATNWDVISIQEEGEGGKKVQSTIRVPSIVRLKQIYCTSSIKLNFAHHQTIFFYNFGLMYIYLFLGFSPHFI